MRDEWAFATSPVGLGLSPKRFWRLTPADYLLLKKIFDQKQEADARRWLLEKIDRLNAPHFGKRDKKPYAIEDFTARQESSQEKIQRDIEFMKMLRKLGSVTANSEPPTSWAKVQWKPEDYPEMFNLKKQ